LTGGVLHAQTQQKKRKPYSFRSAILLPVQLSECKGFRHTNNYTSFTNSQNSFELGMASIKADYSIGKVDGVIDLGFGRRAEEFSIMMAT
jgi:hypothetical protein